jgi:hypothetical protein
MRPPKAGSLSGRWPLGRAVFGVESHVIARGFNFQLFRFSLSWAYRTRCPYSLVFWDGVGCWVFKSWMPIGYTCSAAVCVWWSVDTSAYICSVLRQLPGIRGCGLCYAGYCVCSGSFPDSGGSLVSPWAHGMNRYVCVPILAHALRGNTLPPWWLRFKVPPENEFYQILLPTDGRTLLPTFSGLRK